MPSRRRTESSASTTRSRCALSTAGPPSSRGRGKSSARPGATSWYSRSGSSIPRQRVRAQVARLRLGGGARGRPRRAAPGRRARRCRRGRRGGRRCRRRSRPSTLGLAGVEARCARAPRRPPASLGGERALGGRGGAHGRARRPRRRRRTRRRGSRPRAADRLDRVADQLAVPREHARIAAPEPLDEPGRALDVAEEQRDRPGRQRVAHPCESRTLPAALGLGRAGGPRCPFGP